MLYMQLKTIHFQSVQPWKAKWLGTHGIDQLKWSTKYNQEAKSFLKKQLLQYKM